MGITPFPNDGRPIPELEPSAVPVTRSLGPAYARWLSGGGSRPRAGRVVGISVPAPLSPNTARP